jgi:hypothetical protein
VAGCLRILFVTLSEIIWVFMNDYGTTPEIFSVHTLQSPRILPNDGIGRLREGDIPEIAGMPGSF